MGGLAGRFTGRGWRVTAVAILVLLIVFCALSARLFVFPAIGMPARVDAIVVLGGSGDRLDRGLRLAADDRAPYLVLSTGLPWIPPGICAQHAGPATVICLRPDPDTTRGEAEGVARLAKRYGWRSMVLVTSRDQVWRAHLRFQRCFAGTIYGVDSPVPWYHWPYAIAYQWAGTVKAELFQRGC
jgi:uncharacterized SAM-binding protein YcdF (DUF218 family)